MSWLDAALGAGAAFGLWSSLRSQAHYASLAAAPDGSALPGSSKRPWPAVSIVIPARNEASNLPRLLNSLSVLDVPRGKVEIIVVDDASADATGDLARAAGARVVRLDESDRPVGWLGKPYACRRGAAAADDSEWVLFLDADTELAPGALRAAIAHATARQVDAVSFLLQQRCESFWERLLLPYAYQQFFGGVDPKRLRDPRTGEALLNGQFILIRRTVYDAVGGHGAVRGSIVEDIALARVLKAAGYRVETLRGEAHGAVRMYRDLGSLREGFGKNAYAFLADEPLRGLRVALASTCATLSFPLLARGWAARGARRVVLLALGALTWLGLSAGLAGWVSRFGVPRAYAALQPLDALVFQAIAVESTIRSLTGRGLAWKGRTYALGRPISRPPLAPKLPRGALWTLTGAIFRHERHSLRAGSAAVVQALAGSWEAHGIDQIPTEGPVCLVINHWQRPGLWIGWGGSLLGWLVNQRRPQADPPVHWLVLSELRLPVFGRERHLAGLDIFLRRVTYAWELVPLSLASGAEGQRAGALRRLRRLASADRVVGFFPEGHRGRAGPLGDPLPGSGRILAWLARAGVAIVPAAIFEQDGRLVARIGASLSPDVLAARRDDAAATAAMEALAALLPSHLRGRWDRTRLCSR